MDQQKKENKSKWLAGLRQQAEQLLRSNTADGMAENQQAIAFQQLIDELHIHQIELEMQNEELLQARVEIESSRNEYADLYEFAPIHYFTLDKNGIIRRLNRMAVQLLGYQRKAICNKRWRSFVAPDHVEIFYDFFKRVRETGTRQVAQLDIINKDGERRSLHMQAVSSAKGREKFLTEEYLLTVTDITDLKKAEEHRQYASQFRQLVAGMPDLYLFLSPAYQVLEASNTYLQDLYRKREEVIGHTLEEIYTQHTYHSPMAGALQQSLSQVSQGLKPHTTGILRHDIQLPDGHLQERYWQVTHSPVLGQEGEINYIIHHITDVTREYRNEKEVEKNKQRFEMLARASNDVIWEWDLNTRQWWWNHNLEKQFGYQGAALEQGIETWAGRIHPDERQAIVDQLMATLANGQKEWRSEYRFLRADGSYAFVLDRGFTVQDAQGKTSLIVGTMLDLSEQKQAELTLKESHQRFAGLLETIPQMAWMLSPDGSAYFFNQKWIEYTGASPDKLKGWGWQSYLHPDDLPRMHQAWLQALQTGQTLELQNRWRTAAAEQYRWHIVRTSPVFDQEGNLTQWVGSLTDIHDQKLHEEALEKRVTERTLELSQINRKLKEEIAWRTNLEDHLRETQLLAKQIADFTPDIVHVYDLVEQKTLYLNYSITDILGYTLDDIHALGTNILQSLIHPDDLAKCSSRMKYLASSPTNDAKEMEYRLKAKDSSWHWVWVRYAVFKRNQEGIPMQIIGIIHDITEKKVSEQNLQQSQLKLKRLNAELEERVARRTKRLQQTFEQLQREFKERLTTQEALQLNQERFQFALQKSPVILFTQDTSLKFTWIHNGFPFGPGQDILGKGDEEVLPAQAAEALVGLKTRVMQTGQGLHEEICLEVSGKRYYYDLTIEPLWTKSRQITGVACAAVDVTETHQARIALARSEHRYRILTESIPEIIFTLDTEGKLDYANSWMSGFTGLPAEALAGDGWWQAIHPDDRQPLQTSLYQALQGQQAHLPEVRFRRNPDAAYIWHQQRMVPLKDTEEHVIRWIGISTDIHAHKLAEEALRNNAELREAQQKLQMERDFSRSLVDNSIDGIITFDTLPRYTSWNRVVEDMYQISREQAVGKPIFEVFPAYQQTEEGQAILQVLQGEKVTLYNQPYESREGFYEINLIPLFDEQKKVIGGIGILHDVSERIRIEQERTRLKLQRQKVLLNAILEAQESERRRIAEALHNGLAQTLYAAKLNLEQLAIEGVDTQSLKESRIKASSLLADAIRETRNISHELIPTILEDFGLKGAIKDFCKKYAHPRFTIQAEIYGFEEKLDKYLEVAIYRIAQELVNNVIKHAEASRLHLHLVKGDNGILLRVTDNGKGFNSSRVMQDLRGIGLKTIHDRIKLLNGSIEVDSKPGKGTAVSIIIPPT